MAHWNYHKRVSAGPGMWFNLSKSGVSTSVGGKGFTLNFGKKGTYLTTSIPGTGIYSREKISPGGDGDASGIIAFIVKILCAGFLVFMGVMLRKVAWISIGAYIIAGIYAVSAIVNLIQVIIQKINKAKAKQTEQVIGSGLDSVSSATTSEYTSTAASATVASASDSTSVDGNNNHTVLNSFESYKGLSDTRAVLEFIYDSGKVISPSTIQRRSGLKYMEVIQCLWVLEEKKICKYDPDAKQYIVLVDSVEEARGLLGE